MKPTQLGLLSQGLSQAAVKVLARAWLCASYRGQLRSRHERAGSEATLKPMCTHALTLTHTCTHVLCANSVLFHSSVPGTCHEHWKHCDLRGELRAGGAGEGKPWPPPLDVRTVSRRSLVPVGSPNHISTWIGSIRKSHTATAQLIGRHQPCPRTPGQPSGKPGCVGAQEGPLSPAAFLWVPGHSPFL